MQDRWPVGMHGRDHIKAVLVCNFTDSYFGAGPDKLEPFSAIALTLHPHILLTPVSGRSLHVAFASGGGGSMGVQHWCVG